MDKRKVLDVIGMNIVFTISLISASLKVFISVQSILSLIMLDPSFAKNIDFIFFIIKVYTNNETYKIMNLPLMVAIAQLIYNAIVVITYKLKRASTEDSNKSV